MALKLEDQWVWDSWYIQDGTTWHAYFLQANKSIGDPELRHWNVSQGHATSVDLCHWDYLGTTFKPASSPAWDDYTTWTGSVVQDDNGLWHLFYTGTSNKEKGLYQRIGHATSFDLQQWDRVGDGLCLDLTGPNAAHYEAEHLPGHWHDRAMRDPWVMRDPDNNRWLMFFTARGNGVEEANAGGAIGVASSHDLSHWELQAPCFVGAYGQLEVPQVFCFENHWYCLFCTAAEHWSEDTKAKSPVPPVTGNHYLMAETPTGPWRLPDTAFLDGALPCFRYAARVIESQDGLKLIGFQDQDENGFAGIILDPVDLFTDKDGHLSLCRKS